MKGIIIAVLLLPLFLPSGLRAQERPVEWSLSECIGYAREQNIQVKKSKVTWAESQEAYLQSKSQLFPALSFSSSHNLVNRPRAVDTDENSYAGNYGFDASVSLYQGGKLRKQIQQQGLQSRIQELYVREAENNIEVAITESFLQVLYAAESVEINRNTLEVSGQECERARELYAAGSIARSDLAQLESQYSTDNYQLVTAEAALAQNKLELKQLLELDISEEIELAVPELTEEEVLRGLPSKQQAYAAALEFMPEIAGSRLAIESAEKEVAIARAGYMPSLNLSAGVGTSHMSGTGYSFTNQVRNNFNESVGVSISIPLFSNRQHKTAVRTARLKVEESELEYQSTQKDLLKTVESVYLDALSSQNRYKAATESLRAALESFSLVQEQFELGMKNTVDFLTEKNKLSSARQELIQAKYMAVLSIQLLDFYQGKGIKL